MRIDWLRGRSVVELAAVPTEWDCYWCDATTPVFWNEHWARCKVCMSDVLFDKDLTPETA